MRNIGRQGILVVPSGTGACPPDGPVMGSKSPAARATAHVQSHQGQRTRRVVATMTGRRRQRGLCLLPVLRNANVAPRHLSFHQLTRIVVASVLVALLAGFSIDTSTAVAATSGPKVAIIVGPAGSQTKTNRAWGNAAAAEAARYTSNVVKVFSPNATWGRVKAAITGASIVVYIGRGRGYPSPYSSALRASFEDGFGLNRVAGVNNTTTKFYGERYIRTARLAPNAVVVLVHAAYASGQSEPGHATPSPKVARRRVDNYGAGFLAIGAAAVIAEYSGAPTYYVRALFTTNRTLDSIWRSAPSRHGHVTSFTSSRTRGAIGRIDPVHRTSGFTRSMVGRPATLASTVRGTPPPAAAAPTKPTPTPTPAPSGIAVPASIDSTGATDASAALISWLDRSVPDGSTVVFKAGGVYRLDAAFKFAHRHNLTFEGNGATLKGNGGTTEASALFWLWSYGGGNTGIVIRNFKLVGNSPTPGVFHSGQEGADAILVDAGSNIEITNVTISGVWGDCLYVAGWADGVSFHDATCASPGRSGVSVTAAKNVTVQRVAFPKSGYCTFNVEPNTSDQGASNIRFLDNTAGTWTNSFLSADGAAGSVVNGITVSGNTVTGASLLTAIDLARRQNIVFTNNTSRVTAYGPVLRFAHVDGLTVTGNTQPLSSGSLASITDSTSVTTDISGS